MALCCRLVAVCMCVRMHVLKINIPEEKCWTLFFLGCLSVFCMSIFINAISQKDTVSGHSNLAKSFYFKKQQNSWSNYYKLVTIFYNLSDKTLNCSCADYIDFLCCFSFRKINNLIAINNTRKT